VPDADVATFVMPHYRDHPRGREHLERAVASIVAQTDASWHLVVIDDGSPGHAASEHLLALGRTLADRMTVLLQPSNLGPGPARNIGVRWAAAHGSGIVLFLDADDESHPQRLQVVRSILATQPDVDLVYSTFTVVDELDRPVAHDDLTPSIAEILEGHDRNPISGPDGWIAIGLDTGYTTLTSTVAVRTGQALAHPFPAARVSEDSHTWLRMCAAARSIAFDPSIPSRYRVPRDVDGSSTRTQIGASFYRQKAQLDADGFHQAAAIAVARGTIAREHVPDLIRRFYVRLSETMRREGEHDLAAELAKQASDTDPAQPGA
jgi:hypothetical protein